MCDEDCHVLTCPIVLWPGCSAPDNFEVRPTVRGYGLMFWFMRNTLAWSYVLLIATSRS